MRWKQFLTPVSNLGPEDVRAFIDKHPEGSFTLLDVRQPAEYEDARIPGTTLIPLPELPDRLAELSPEKPVIAY
ncbi:MAG: rhodanese-like domain-containing protein [Desulfobacterales bacterium]|nr:MAG: rhodanese-like domain-containing protein [Desulfobacterales bacterium]